MTKATPWAKYAQLLDDHEDYKVLRRLKSPWPEGVDVSKEEKVNIGLYVDCESTGLDTAKSEVIELGMVPFMFTPDGRLSPGGLAYHSYNEPGIPIEPQAQEVHGLSMEKVKGHRINQAEVDSIVECVDLVIAHNAAFDRRMLERVSAKFIGRCWGCSMAEVPWPKNVKRLELILNNAGRFYEAHGAIEDCHAGIFALQQVIDGKTALAHILESARAVSYHVWAIDAPYDKKDALKNRGYFWNGGEDGRNKAWHREIKESELNDERSWLSSSVYRRGTIPARFDKVNAFSRFSVRG